MPNFNIVIEKAPKKAEPAKKEESKKGGAGDKKGADA